MAHVSDYLGDGIDPGNTSSAFLGLVLLINSSGGLQGRSGTLAIGLKGPAVMLFTGFSLFVALRVEWHERQKGMQET